jgi:hypothetical protein
LPKFQIGISRKQQPTTVVLSLYAQQHPKKKKQKSSHLSPFFDQPTDSDMASKENAVALVDPHQLASVIRSSRLDKVSAFCENKTIQ